MHTTFTLYTKSGPGGTSAAGSAKPSCRQNHGPGRPREFDMDEALDQAMETFWIHGYHATSINDLSLSMGLTKGSLYKAFKDKKAIFLAAFERYVSGSVLGNFEQDLAAKRPPLELIQTLLVHYARISATARGTKGCLVTATAMEMLPHDPDIAKSVAAALGRIHDFLLTALRLGKQDGSLTAELDAQAAALFLLCVIQGMRVVGKTAPKVQALRQVVQLAMRTIST